jgi:hypothetical protein
MWVTHERIAVMLGVRREGVTEAAVRLQRDGLIRYSRGHIHVLDRGRLEHHSCECYGVVERAYEQLRNRSSAWPSAAGRPDRVSPCEAGRMAPEPPDARRNTIDTLQARRRRERHAA